MTAHRIATIPGDGIGREVVPAAQDVLALAGERHGFRLEWTEFDWSCEYYTRTGRMMPADGLDQVAAFDAIFLGAVGYPGVPDHVSLWGLLIPMRRAFAQYVNLRPVRLLRGIESPLRGSSRATWTSWSSGRTTRASTRRSADASTAALHGRWPCRKRSSPGPAWSR
ncbi:isocitrate/isopropylmalate family dehydrogenase [Phytohabitans flavus]|uniref:isocitrate/isopropylmalate family dehydrogenase n=1 Tax=Phytohabitans flavus TaxID=1076124 RepID=UPI00364389D6